jgi:hypothetical protein
MPPAHDVSPKAPAGAESLRACFGVGCAQHHRCARYEAVGGSEASSDTLGTCLSAGGCYPMFIDLAKR